MAMANRVPDSVPTIPKIRQHGIVVSPLRVFSGQEAAVERRARSRNTLHAFGTKLAWCAFVSVPITAAHGVLLVGGNVVIFAGTKFSGLASLVLGPSCHSMLRLGSCLG